MQNLIVSPIIGGLVAIIITGLWMHDGAAPFGRSGTSLAAYESGSSCHFSASTASSLSPMLVGAMIRHGVHC